MRIRSVLTHSGQAVLEGALIAMLAVGLMAGTAFAARGGGGGKPAGGTTGGGSVGVVLLNSSDGLAHFGQQVTFNVSASVSQPWVNLNCYQGSTWVDGEWGGFFAGSAWGTTFTLGPTSLWVSGGANCTASLVYYNSKGSLTTLGTTSFPVYP